MKIDIHNYEEFFLMYVDNELSAEEREMVEGFVVLHPELGEELELLRSTVLPTDEAIFVPKTELLKLDSRIQEESLLLHLDNELEPSLVPALEASILKDPETGREWEILKKTRLDRDEKIEFPNKKLLYRHEPARIVSMKFFRYAAAAIMIGAAIFFGLKLTDNTTTPDGPVIAEEKVIPVDPVNTPVIKDQLAEVELPVRESKETKMTEDARIVRENTSLASNVRKPVKEQKAQERKEVDSPEKVVPQMRIDEMTVYRNESPSMPKLAVNDKPVEIIDRDMTAKPESYAMLASLEEPQEEVLYMNEEKVSRSKVGRIFRQVKRVVERNTNINAPDGIRIGGFEIALK